MSIHLIQQLPLLSEFPHTTTRWNTNEEVASLLLSALHHPEWLQEMSPSGLFPVSSTQRLRLRSDGYKQDGYFWRRRKDTKLIREDHMKLKVKGHELIHANYTHSAVVPAFHRRVYWLIDKPEMVLIHYLNHYNNEDLTVQMEERIANFIHTNDLQISLTQLREQMFPIFPLLDQIRLEALVKAVWQRCGNLDYSASLQGGNLTIGTSSSSCVQQNNLYRSLSCSNAMIQFSPVSATASTSVRRQPSALSDGFDRCHGEVCRRDVNLDLEDSAHCSIATDSSSDIGLNSSLSDVVEFAPDSASCSGPSKILITGPWYSDGREYSVLFGEKTVRAEILRAGVLRCFTPVSERPGIVQLCVRCDNRIVSNVYPFRFIGNDSRGGEDSMVDALLTRLNGFLSGNSSSGRRSLTTAKILEEELLDLCQENRFEKVTSSPGIKTLLHYTAALGYSRLLTTLLCLRESESQLSDWNELDPMARDENGRLPIHMAVESGCVNCIRKLMEECRDSMYIPDHSGETAIALSERLGRSIATVVHSKKHQAMSSDFFDVSLHSTALWVLNHKDTAIVDEGTMEMDESSISIIPTNLNVRVEENEWLDESLNVDVQLDIPDSPKTAHMWQAVTSPGAVLNEGMRAKIATLAQEIIDALPARIKGDDDKKRSSSSIGSEMEKGLKCHSKNPFLLSAVWPPGQSESNEIDAFYEHPFRTGVNDVDPLDVFSDPPSQSNMIMTTNEHEDTSNEAISPTHKDLSEFFNGDVPARSLTKMLTGLRLSDREQRELFGAAKVIQSAWRQYRQVRLSSQRQLEAERTAAVLIQSYYRRYKQFCYFKKLHKSVVFVQKHFRLNKANRHLASSSVQSKTTNREERAMNGDHPIRPNRHLASSSIQSHTASREERAMDGDHPIRPNPHLPSSSVPLQLQHEAATCIQHAFRGHYRKRQAAARKIQKFMLESKQKQCSCLGEVAMSTGGSRGGGGGISKRQRLLTDQQLFRMPIERGDGQSVMKTMKMMMMMGRSLRE